MIKFFFSSLKTNYLQLLEKLAPLIHKNDAKSAHELFFKYSEILNEFCCWNDLELKRKSIISRSVTCHSEIGNIVHWFFSCVELGRQADVYLKGCLTKALAKRNLELIEFYLSKGIRLENEDWKRSDVPMSAMFVLRNNILRNRKEMITLLLKYGLNCASYRNNEGSNFLLEITYNATIVDEDAVETAEILINSGIPVNEPDNYGNTPLLNAILSTNIRLVSLLIQKGADVNSKTSQQLPLCRAASFCGLKIVELLLRNGAKINERDPRSGFTALHNACSYNYAMMIYFLICKGADVCIENNAGETPFMLLKRVNDNWIPFSILPQSMKSFNKSICVMIKGFAKAIYEKRSMHKSHTNFFEKNAKVRDYLKRYIAELDIKFYGNYTFYTVLKMATDVEKLARKVKNKKFLSKLEESLKSAHFYQWDLKLTLAEAIRIRDEQEIVYSRLKYTFGDSLPTVVLRELEKFLKLEDLPMVQ